MKYGFHRIITHSGEVIDGPVVVETDSEGNLLSWHILEGEEPFVEWRGGEKYFTLREK